jgi:predicted dehydrogenase
MADRLTRRTFLKTSALVAGTAAGLGLIHGPTLLGAGAKGQKLRCALVGVQGRGGSHLGAAAGEHIVAMTDVDVGHLDGARKFLTDPKNVEKHKLESQNVAAIKTYADFRKMFDECGKNIDAVFIAIPDHNHAAVAMMAIKMGKHVYCEKPLTHDIWEARALGQAAKQYKVQTQMGNQGHCGDGYRRLVEYIRAGAIGTVKEVHTWCDNSICPCGGTGGRPPTKPVPAGVDWDQWIGTAPFREYHDNLHPAKWRGWWDFGSGLLGDWGCHMADGAHWILNYRMPTSIEVVKSAEGGVEMFPAINTIKYSFPAEGSQPAVTYYWWDGLVAKGKPHRPELADELEKKYDRKLGGKGSLYVGDKGVMYTGAYGGGTSFLPPERQKEIPEPEKTLPRNGEIFQEFIGAAKGGPACTSNFTDAGGPLTELLLLGILGMRAGQGATIEWDAANLKCTNKPELNKYVKREYRKGWTV